MGFGRWCFGRDQIYPEVLVSFFLSLLTWQVGSQGDISDDDRQAKDHRGKVEGQCPTNNSQQPEKPADQLTS